MNEWIKESIGEWIIICIGRNERMKKEMNVWMNEAINKEMNGKINE